MKYPVCVKVSITEMKLFNELKDGPLFLPFLPMQFTDALKKKVPNMLIPTVDCFSSSGFQQLKKIITIMLLCCGTVPKRTVFTTYLQIHLPSSNYLNISLKNCREFSGEKEKDAPIFPTSF